MGSQRFSTLQNKMAASLFRDSCIVSFVLLCLSFNSRAMLVSNLPHLLRYHNGPLLTGEEPIKVYATFYGMFTDSEKSTLRSFLRSFTTSGAVKDTPTVAKWWALTRGYIDLHANPVSQEVLLQGETVDNYSLGTVLKRRDISSLVENSLQVFPIDNMAIYLVFTAADVYVEGFCMNTCGQHLYTQPSTATKGQVLPYAWVGNPQSQCPGYCAWPFARPELGPRADPLKAPNAVGADGMIITLAKVLAGAATNPFGTAYFEGDAGYAVEVAGACAGAFGVGAYPGYPGQLLEDATGASYNVRGYGDTKFLVPWIWNPASLSCEGQSDNVIVEEKEAPLEKLQSTYRIRFQKMMMT